MPSKHIETGEPGDEYHVACAEDRPLTGMWHCGPNAGWVEVTHLPTMISARAFDKSQHRARQAAMACCEMMVEQSRLTKCRFPERLSALSPTINTKGPRDDG